MNFKNKLTIQKNGLIKFVIIIIIPIITPLLVSKQFTSIHDLAYFLTAAIKIYNGQIPFVDFITVHPPGSYFILVGLFKIFGTNYLGVIVWMIFVNIISSFCIYEILKKFQINKKNLVFIMIGFGLLAPYSLFSQIWYDSDTLFFVIVSSYFLNNIKDAKTLKFSYLFIGILSFLPFLIKQNIGLITMLITSFTVIFICKTILKNKILFFFGQIITFLTFAIYLIQNGAYQSWLFYNFYYPSVSRFRSIITDIFPIRFLEKYSFEMEYELVYYFFYATILAISFKLYSNIFTKKINFFYFTQFLLITFTLFLNFDQKVYFEFFNFINNKVVTINNFENSTIILFFFIIATFLNLFFVNFKIQLKTLIQSFFSINIFILFCFFIPYIYRLSLTTSYEERSLISFEYYLKYLFFVYFPVILVSLFIAIKEYKKYGVVIFPLLAYLYGTSLSQGVSGSTAASVGIVIFLLGIIFDYFMVKHRIVNGSNFYLVILFSFFFLTAIFGSRYFFIKYENNYSSSFSSFSYLTLQSSHFKQQDIAKTIIDDYKEEYKKIVFVPESTLAYFTNLYTPKIDVTTFDSTANPYNTLFNTSSIKYFLDCNNIDLVSVNTNPHRKYFDEFVKNRRTISEYLGPNYVELNQIGDFLIYKQIERVEIEDHCNLVNNGRK